MNTDEKIDFLVDTLITLKKYQKQNEENLMTGRRVLALWDETTSKNKSQIIPLDVLEASKAVRDGISQRARKMEQNEIILEALSLFLNKLNEEVVSG